MNEDRARSKGAGRRLGLPGRFALGAGLGLTFLLVACASPPETRYYDIRLPDPGSVAGASLGKVIVDAVTVPDHLDGPEIFYRTSTYEAGYYGYHLWVRPLSESLSDEIVAYLKSTGRFERVSAPPETPGAGGIHLSLAIREFAEIDGEGDVWTAAIHVDLKLGDGSARRPVERTIRRSEPIAPRNAGGTVVALNKAWSEVAEAILHEIVSFSAE